MAKDIQDWTKERRIGSIYITPGSPWKQAHVESFHDKLRDERLNGELFGSLAEARVILEQWRIEHNQVRPHSALGYQTPEEFAARHNPKWGVVSKDLNNPKRLFKTGPVEPAALMGRSRRLQLSPLEQLPKEKTAHPITSRPLR